MVMPRIDVADDLTGWMGLRPEMAAGLGAFSEAVYSKSQLPMRIRELARMRIALANGCEVCRNARDAEGTAHGVDEALYEHALEWRTWQGYSQRERLAAEYAERFAGDHRELGADDAFWRRLRAEYDDAEIVDLAMCCALWLGAGRTMHVLDVGQSCQLVINKKTA
jgi:AhpD family alkylhydroperoxidase